MSSQTPSRSGEPIQRPSISFLTVEISWNQTGPLQDTLPCSTTLSTKPIFTGSALEATELNASPTPPTGRRTNLRSLEMETFSLYPIKTELPIFRDMDWCKEKFILLLMFNQG